MNHAVKNINEGGLIFMHRQHWCPECGQLLELGCIEKVVNSNSPEAKDYDFRMPGGRGSYVGNVLFRIGCFYCANCEKPFRAKQIRAFEKAQKQKEKEKERQNPA